MLKLTLEATNLQELQDLIHALGAAFQPPTAAQKSTAVAQPPAPQPAGPRCPTHGKATQGKRGLYCPTKLQDGSWCPWKLEPKASTPPRKEAGGGPARE